jgi:hypothetical protein
MTGRQRSVTLSLCLLLAAADSADYSSRKPVTQLPLLVSFGVMVGF